MGYELRDDAAGGEGSRQWQTHTCTHTHSVSSVIHRVDGDSKRIGRNLDTCKRGPPLINLMGYEHREDAMGGGGSKQCQIHTHTQRVSHRMDGASSKDRTQS